MDEEGDRNTSKTNTTLVEPVDFNIRGMENVFSKDDRISSGPSKQDDVSSVQPCREILGPAVNIFEVVLLSAVLRNRRAKFEVDSHACPRDDHTSNPNE